MQGLRDSWRLLTASANEQRAQECFNEIVAAYSRPSRRYHNLDHITEMLQLSQQFKLSSREVVDFAIFYHDVVYKVPALDNEHKSAVMAADRLAKLNVPLPVIEDVCLFIEATKTHELAAARNLDDLKLFLDFDLSILAADWPVYELYLQSIRKEYRFYPDLLYYPGRKSFLENMLAKEHIYHTETFRTSHEAKARQNMQRELDIY